MGDLLVVEPHVPKWKLALADGAGCLDPVPFNEPGCAVGIAEGEQRVAELLDGVEGVPSGQDLLDRAKEALGAAVAPSGGSRASRRVPLRAAGTPTHSALW